MKAVIIEDETAAAVNLAALLGETFPDMEIMATLESVAETVEWFSAGNSPDMAFMDIHLADGNSFLVFDSITVDIPIIFTTAYDMYALDAFKVNSIDYLLKPIHQERLNETIVKYESLADTYLKEYNEAHELPDVLKNLNSPEKKYRTRFLIASTEKYHKLSVEDIAYFYTEEKVTFAVTYTGKEHIIDLPLERLCEQLNPDKFFRANRQVVLNIDSITRIEPYFQSRIVVHVRPEFKEKILISREKISTFKLWLNY